MSADFQLSWGVCLFLLSGAALVALGIVISPLAIICAITGLVAVVAAFAREDAEWLRRRKTQRET